MRITLLQLIAFDSSKMVLVVFCFAFALFTNAATASPQGRITGGTPTDISEVPYVAALVYHYPRIDLYIQRCVGPLISSWHVLTAAYCFTGATQDNFTVRAGSSTSLSGGVTTVIQQVITHPNYVATPRQNDIAIVFVREPFRISNVIASVRLSPQNYDFLDGSAGVVAGWGFEDEPAQGGTQHGSLRKIVLRKVPQDTCTAAFAANSDVSISDTVFCATEINKGVCFGDAGAPMVSTIYNSEGLVGISSYYQECGTTYPDLFTRVDRYTNWIMRTAVAPTEDVRDSMNAWNTPVIA